ncbi:MAG TPA: hypothetical protein VN604_01310 [Nitrospirota bacterium]|nr:hypothetical protein [Nitrospirota bacterium]
MKTSRSEKRSGVKRAGAWSESSAFRVERSSGARRAAIARQNAEEKAITLWKGVIANRNLRDLNLHLQGLYAELGKAVYDLQGKKPDAVSKRSRELKDLFGKIAEMRSKISKIEQASRHSLKTA